MSTPSPDEIRRYVAELARLSGDRPDDQPQQLRIATALPSLLALAKRLGPWPSQVPAGPLDPGV